MAINPGIGGVYGIGVNYLNSKGVVTGQQVQNAKASNKKKPANSVSASIGKFVDSVARLPVLATASDSARQVSKFIGNSFTSGMQALQQTPLHPATNGLEKVASSIAGDLGKIGAKVGSEFQKVFGGNRGKKGASQLAQAGRRPAAEAQAQKAASESQPAGQDTHASTKSTDDSNLMAEVEKDIDQADQNVNNEWGTNYPNEVTDPYAKEELQTQVADLDNEDLSDIDEMDA